jgi:hypothetical protein
MRSAALFPWSRVSDTCRSAAQTLSAGEIHVFPPQRCQRRRRRAHNPPACAKNLSHQVSAQCAIPTWFIDHFLAPNQRRHQRRTQPDGNPVFSVTVKNTRYPPENRNSLIFLSPKSNPFQFRPLMRTREHFRYFGPSGLGSANSRARFAALRAAFLSS